MKRFFTKTGHWLVDRLVRIPERDRRFTCWLMIALLTGTTISAIIYAIGNPIGASFSSHAFNIGKAVAINSVLFLVWTIVVGALFSFIYLPLPRLLLASFSYSISSTIFILLSENSGKLFSFLIGIGYNLTTILFGLLLIVIFHKNVGKATKVITVTSLLGLILAYPLTDMINNNQITVPAIADHSEQITDENPGEKGNYNYTFLTYGSGQDFHREEFGEKVNLITPTVDASDFITKWGKGREKFWGFNPSQLPVNGRLWLPDGQGTFPIILMVHGNHTMEYFSTDGYDYLGELLASRGFIAISVDEDFINYSNTFGAPNDNYKLRTWMLLQHLVQLQEMNNNPESYLFQKINFQQVALVGHSRGGQAAFMGADYKTFFNDDDELLANLEPVDIKAVVAIAPTDTKVDGKKPHIHNTSYLLLHGARDADVYDFRGDQQFYRTTFDKNYNGFKTTLYIEEANHTQFNTSWGRTDLSLPRGIFLNKQQTMAPEDQRQIAKVYLSAFFERVFHENHSYEKLFQNYRYGQQWLPETTLVSKYHHATYQPMMKFNRKNEEPINVNGFTEASITTPQDRRGRDRLQDALKLEWESNAVFSIDLANVDFRNNEQIVLTVANIDDGEDASIPNLMVELETTDGVSFKLPLDEFMAIPPIISTDYTHFGLFDNVFRDGNYKRSWEPVFQTIDIPIEAFTKANPKIQRDKIDKMTLHFPAKSGKIFIEEIGVY